MTKYGSLFLVNVSLKFESIIRKWQKIFKKNSNYIKIHIALKFTTLASTVSFQQPQTCGSHRVISYEIWGLSSFNNSVVAITNSNLLLKNLNHTKATLNSLTHSKCLFILLCFGDFLIIIDLNLLRIYVNEWTLLFNLHSM